MLVTLRSYEIWWGRLYVCSMNFTMDRKSNWVWSTKCGRANGEITIKGNSWPQHILALHWRCDVVIKPTKIVPGEEDDGVGPRGRMLNRIDISHRPVFAFANAFGRVITVQYVRRNPAQRRQIVVLDVGGKLHGPRNMVCQRLE